MKAYAIQIGKGTYLTDTLEQTDDLQECWWFKDKATAELYLEDRWQRVIEIEIRKEQGQWVAYKEQIE